MVDRTIEWGDPPAYFTGDGGSNAPDGNFVVAETSGGVKLLEWDDTAQAWQVRGDVDASGQTVDVDTLNATAVSTGLANITGQTVLGYVVGQSDTLLSNRISDFADAGAAAEDLISQATGSPSKNDPTAFGVHIVLPAGNLSGDITATTQQGVRISGQGMGRTELDGKIELQTQYAQVGELLVDNNPVVIGADGADISEALLRRVQVNEPTTDGIQIRSAFSSRVESCRVVQASGNGILAGDCQGLDIENTNVSESSTEGIRLERISGSSSNASQKAVHIGNGSLIINNDSHGIQARGVDGITVDGATRLETNNQGNNDTNDIQLTGDSSGTPTTSALISGCHFEGGGSDRIGGFAGVRASNATHTTIEANKFRRYNGNSGLATRAAVRVESGNDPTYVYGNQFENNNNDVSTGDRTRLGPAGVTLASVGNLSLPNPANWDAGDIIVNLDDFAVFTLREPGNNTGEILQLKRADAQDLSGETGARDGYEARDDGTNTTGSGVVCMWDGTNNQWIPQSSDAAFS